MDLLLALPRPKVMRRLWSQLAALGVGRIILTNAARVERHYFDTHVIEPALYHAAADRRPAAGARHAAAVVSIHRRLKVLVEDDLDALFPAGVRAAGAAGPGGTPTRVLAGAGPARALLAVGPEGGWTAFELDLLGAARLPRRGHGPAHAAQRHRHHRPADAGPPRASIPDWLMPRRL